MKESARAARDFDKALLRNANDIREREEREDALEKSEAVGITELGRVEQRIRGMRDAVDGLAVNVGRLADRIYGETADTVGEPLPPEAKGVMPMLQQVEISLDRLETSLGFAQHQFQRLSTLA